MAKTTLQCRMASELPYGVWAAPDGREVLFNRAYEPIWQRRSSGVAERADRTEAMTSAAWAWFYLTEAPPWLDRDSHARCEAVLIAWGVPTPDLPPPSRSMPSKAGRIARLIARWPASSTVIRQAMLTA